VPLLSRDFLLDEGCFKAILEGHQNGSMALPVLVDLKGFQSVWKERQTLIESIPTLKERLPFLSSVLNRANRVPPNSDFQESHKDNMETLRHSLSNLLMKDRRPLAALGRRVPKYASFVFRGTILPPAGDFGVPGDSAYNANVQELLRRILPHDKLEAQLSLAGHQAVHGEMENTTEIMAAVEASSEETSYSGSVIFSTDGTRAALELVQHLEAELR